MSLPIALAALGAAGMARQLTLPRVRTMADLKERFGTKAHDQLGAIESAPSVVDCGFPTKCAYDAAIARSYARCEAAGGKVGAVCGLTTKGMELIGDGVDAAVSFVKGLF